MFSVKAISEDSRTVAVIRNVEENRVEKTIWFTEKSRNLDMSKAGNFERDISKYADSDLKIRDYHKYRYEAVPHNKVAVKFPRFINYYLAQSNSGKSYNIAQYCKHYMKAFPKNTVIYASANPLSNDRNYASIASKIKEIDLMKMERVIDFTEVKDCLFIFDDCDSTFSTSMTDLDERLTDEFVSELSIKERNNAAKMLQTKTKLVTDLINASIKSLMFNGRKNNISLCIVGHKFNDGIFQKTILSESSAVIMFPYSVSKPILYTFLKDKLNFTKDESNEISCMDWYQYDFLYVNTSGKTFIITPDTLKLY